MSANNDKMIYMLDERKNNLLATIVEEYSKNAEPIGSKFIIERSGLNLSSATVRNEMVKLEDAGYIYQPHTSAGRMPTEKGYQYYVNNFLTDDQPDKKSVKCLENALKINSDRKIKDLAKCLADLSGQGVMVGFSPKEIYYTGISNLFHQPEFRNYDYVFNMSLIIDHLDEAAELIYDKIKNSVDILIGKNNPFGDDASAIVGKFNSKKYQQGILGIFGPLRMDYQKNYNLLKYCQKLINKI